MDMKCFSVMNMIKILIKELKCAVKSCKKYCIILSHKY